MTLTVGSLFAGIGGFDLGFERAGMRTEWFVEQDAYCQAVLRKHWPDVPIFDDVRDVGAHNLPRVDVLCGGFPCQDISSAGKQAGLDGARSGLWFEYLRVIGELRPRYVVVENVPVLRTRGLDTVITGLARLGYDAEWSVVSAAEAGAPHLRKRIWIVAYPGSTSRHDGTQRPSESKLDSDTDSERLTQHGELDRRTEGDATHGYPFGAHADGLRSPVADADRVGQLQSDDSTRPVARQRTREGAGRRGERGGSGVWAPAWEIEPDVGRVAHGVPARMDRLRSLGNALVPQIAEYIGHQIMAYEEAA